MMRWVQFAASATEMEIIEGLVNAPGAQEHAMAYVRELKDIPKESVGEFLGPHHEYWAGNREHFMELKSSIAQRVKKFNFKSLSFAEYCS